MKRLQLKDLSSTIPLPKDLLVYLSENNLQRGEVKLCCLISLLCNEGINCVSNQKIGEHLGISEDWAKKMLSSLNRRGIVTIVKRDGMRFIYPKWNDPIHRQMRKGTL